MHHAGGRSFGLRRVVEQIESLGVKILPYLPFRFNVSLYRRDGKIDTEGSSLLDRR